MHKCQLSFDCGHSKTAAADISGGCSLFGHRISITGSAATVPELAPASCRTRGCLRAAPATSGFSLPTRSHQRHLPSFLPDPLNPSNLPDSHVPPLLPVPPTHRFCLGARVKAGEWGPSEGGWGQGEVDPGREGPKRYQGMFRGSGKAYQGAIGAGWGYQGFIKAAGLHVVNVLFLKRF